MVESTSKKSSYPSIRWKWVVEELRIYQIYRARLTAIHGKEARARESLGFNLADWQDPDLGSDTLAKVDLSRLPEAPLFKRVYDYAYQVGDERARALFDESDLHKADSFCDAFMDLVPIDVRVPLVLWAVQATAVTRYRLQEGWFLDAQELALLAGMKDEVAEDLLKAEGLIEEDDLEVDTDRAEAWLKRQSGFRSTLLPQDVGISVSPMIEELLRAATFDKAVGRAVYLIPDSIATLAARTGVDEEWLIKLVNGRYVAYDVEALEQVAIYLGVDVDLFVSRAVEAIRGAVPDDKDTNSEAFDEDPMDFDDASDEDSDELDSD